jgi:hypothetical protein
MTKITRLLFSLLILIIAGKTATAQYNYSTFNAPFQFLANPTVISAAVPDWDDDEFNVAIGFPVNAFGTFYDSIVVESNGSIILHNGITGGSIWSTADTLPVFLGFGEFLSNNGTNDLVYRNSGESPISYQLTGVPGARIAKVEWKNASFYNSTNGFMDTLNFQVWIYEVTGDVEYRYGASYVTPDAYNGAVGPTVGITSFGMDPVNYQYDLFNGYYFLTGDSNNVSVSANYGQITGTPLAGTVYRFANQVNLGVGSIKGGITASVFPNPASGIVNVKLEVEGSAALAITDLSGRTLITRQVEGNGAVTTAIDVTSLAKGIYMLTIDGNTIGSKLVIQ